MPGLRQGLFGLTGSSAVAQTLVSAASRLVSTLFAPRARASILLGRSCQRVANHALSANDAEKSLGAADTSVRATPYLANGLGCLRYLLTRLRAYRLALFARLDRDLARLLL